MISISSSITVSAAYDFIAKCRMKMTNKTRTVKILEIYVVLHDFFNCEKSNEN